MDDPRDPFNNGARAQSFTPALNETWDYINDQIRGVNLGGWLVLEPFIVPALFEKYQNSTPSPALPGGLVVDEWSLSVAMSNDTGPGGGLSQLEDHYKTFIVSSSSISSLLWPSSILRQSRTSLRSQEQVSTGSAFLCLTGLSTSGLVNLSCRRPRGTTSFSLSNGHGSTVCACSWNCIRHREARMVRGTVKSSLNFPAEAFPGLNHSGRLGPINFLNGPMGIANADRTMGYIRVLAEFISQSEYQDVIQMFGVINEPLMGIIGRDPLDRL